MPDQIIGHVIDLYWEDSDDPEAENGLAVVLRSPDPDNPDVSLFLNHRVTITVSEDE
jgi:hypothetical protein